MGRRSSDAGMGGRVRDGNVVSEREEQVGYKNSDGIDW
jgi:hypothetical protein